MNQDREYKKKMVNLYSLIKESSLFPKIEINELLFVEYSCMAEDTKFGLWSKNNYFAFISSGKKIWKTIYHSYEVDDGDIIFVKKGANLAHQFFDEKFCAVFMFIPDDFIKAFLQRHAGLLDAAQKNLSKQDAVLRVQKDELLESYYQSIQSYLALSKKPNEQLLMLKFEELLLSLFTNPGHSELTDYFISLCQNQHYHMNSIMESNFAYNLKLENYAQLCHMSLSTFKKTFKEYYNCTPASWLKDRRLDLACQKVLTTNLTVSQIALDCGFEDPSHFIRVFKKMCQLTPFQYRQKHLKVADSNA